MSDEINLAPAVHRAIIMPVLTRSVPAHMNTPTARAILLAVGLQESRLKHRYQLGRARVKEPRVGLWRLCVNDISGLLRHSRTRSQLIESAQRAGVASTSRAIVEAIETNDALACICARLLMFTNPWELPTTEQTAWEFYGGLWKPALPQRQTWGEFYEIASDVVTRQDYFRDLFDV